MARAKYLSVGSDCEDPFFPSDEWEAEVLHDSCSKCGGVSALPKSIHVQSNKVSCPISWIGFGRNTCVVLHDDLVAALFTDDASGCISASLTEGAGRDLPFTAFLPNWNNPLVIRGGPDSWFWKCSACNRYYYSPVGQQYLIIKPDMPSGPFFDACGTLIISEELRNLVKPASRGQFIYRNLRLSGRPQDGLPDNLFDAPEEYEFPGPKR